MTIGASPLGASPLGGAFQPGPPYIQIGYTPPAGPSPYYDVIAVLPVGYTLTRENQDALWLAYQTNHFVPLTSALALSAVAGVDGPQPAPLTSIKRLWGIDDAPLIMAPSASDSIVGGPLGGSNAAPLDEFVLDQNVLT